MFDSALAHCRSMTWKSVLKPLGWIGLTALSVAVTSGVFIATRMKLTYEQYPHPQATLILDGGKNRMKKAVMFAQEHPHLPIWVSGNCSHRPSLKTAFTLARLSKQVHYDLRATDTVTNFTTLVEDFQRLDIRHVYLVTSAYHMDRSNAIATLVFGSRGIVVTPIALPEIGYPQESKVRVLRDSLRSLLWITTGQASSRFNAHVNHFPGGESCLFQFRKNQARQR